MNQKDSSATPESCKEASAGPVTPISVAVGKAIEEQAKVANANNSAHAFRTGVIYELVVLTLIAILSFFLPRHIRPEAMQEG